MDVRERIRRARLIEKISEHTEYAERIGLNTFNASQADISMLVVKETTNQKGVIKGDK